MDTPELGICWSCQKKLTARGAVRTDGDHAIQCCKKCWAEISPGSRMRIAAWFYDRSDLGLGIEETLAIFRDLVANSISGYFNKFDDPRGRMN